MFWNIFRFIFPWERHLAYPYLKRSGWVQSSQFPHCHCSWSVIYLSKWMQVKWGSNWHSENKFRPHSRGTAKVRNNLDENIFVGFINCVECEVGVFQLYCIAPWYLDAVVKNNNSFSTGWASKFGFRVRFKEPPVVGLLINNSLSLLVLRVSLVFMTGIISFKLSVVLWKPKL